MGSVIKNESEAMKFICKDMWIYCFGEPVSSLKTNLSVLSNGDDYEWGLGSVYYRGFVYFKE